MSYKSCDILKNPIIEEYIKGRRRLSKTKVELLDNSITKYNKEFLSNINELNGEFYKLIRADMIAIELINRYCTNAKEIDNIRNLIRAQSGAISFNGMLKKALKSYSIKHSDIHKAIKDDIDKEYDRVKRNQQTLYVIFDELGISILLHKMKEVTGMDFVEYISYVEETYEIEKPIFDKFDEEARKQKAEYYSKLTEYTMELIQFFVSENNIDIKENISEALRLRREAYKKDKENKQKEKEDNKKDKILQRINRNAAYIQMDITASYGDALKVLKRAEASDLYKRVEKLEKVYYVAFTKITKTEKSERIHIRYAKNDIFVESPSEMDLFRTKKEAIEAKNKLEERYIDESMVYTIHQLLVNKPNDTYSDEKIAKKRQEVEAERREQSIRIQEEKERERKEDLIKEKIKACRFMNININTPEELEQLPTDIIENCLFKYRGVMGWPSWKRAEYFRKEAAKEVDEMYKKQYEKQAAVEKEKRCKKREKEKKEIEEYKLRKDELQASGDQEAYISCLVCERRGDNYFTGKALPSSYLKKSTLYFKNN